MIPAGRVSRPVGNISPNIHIFTHYAPETQATCVSTDHPDGPSLAHQTRKRRQILLTLVIYGGAAELSSEHLVGISVHTYLRREAREP